MVCSADLVIQNTKGLHARAAASFVKAIQNINAEVTVTKAGQTVGGDSIMGLMMLAAAKGTTIHVEAEGDEAQKAVEIISNLINTKFGED
ncbi:MAG: HPr family phosphocarrier protein [Alphaproteobacteria bacterium]|nr:HPr family phosphocarrier protein [Alphaproteobacteria bacterium]MBR6327666.1 HPr family phosphocarrier protein [Alphaproteobacteria bacterium]